MNDLEIQYKKLEEEIKKLKKENEIKTKENKLLKKQNKQKDEIIFDLDKNQYKEKYNSTLSNYNSLLKINNEQNNEIQELKKKVKDLESKLGIQSVRIKKDSSNSSKPSSTNGFKKVITNRRAKSNKKQGGQTGHVGTFLSDPTFRKNINISEVETEVVEINKNDLNKDKKVIFRKVIDIDVKTKITIYKYYPDCDGKYNIKKEHNTPIQYGEKIKAMAIDLMIESNNSTDAVVKFIGSITNGVVKISKGTLVDWQNKCAKILEPQIQNIQENLMKAYYTNNDESQIKINGEASNVLGCSNKEYTRLWISKSKSMKALDEIGFLNHYDGIVVKDGTDLYNNCGEKRSQCLSHILRYIKGISDFNGHIGAIEMSKLLSDINEKRNKYVSSGKEKFEKEEIKEFNKNFKEIFKKWKKEWMKSSEEKNPVYEDERRLLSRFEDKKELKEILYFINDFKVPSTNNQIETDLRPIKIKQKIGKFRSECGAECYAEIRSCINTYKKQNYSPFNMLVKGFRGDLQIV